MYKCSNITCNAQYSNEQADKLKGDCEKCHQPLADEKGLGWRFLHPVKKEEPPAVPVKSTTTNAPPKGATPVGMKPRIDSADPGIPGTVSSPKKVDEHANIPGTATTTKVEGNTKAAPQVVSQPKP